EVSGLPALVSYFRRYRHGNFRVVYHPTSEKADDEFDAVCRLMLLVRNVCFAVDEIWEFCSAGHLPGPLRRIAFRGRHPGVTLLWTAQRPVRVATDLRAQTSRYYV